jgi:predicted PurR-regulated permease PerM
VTTAPRWFLIGLGIILSAVVVYYFSNIVIYLLIAGLLSLVGQPLMEWLARKEVKRIKIPRSIASLMTMGLMLLITLLFISIFIPLIIKEANVIASLDVAQLSDMFEKPVQRAEEFLDKAGLLKGQSLNEYIQQRLKNLISVTNVSNLLEALVSATGNIFLAFVSVSFILFFFLKEKDLFYKIILTLVPDGYEQKMDKTFHGIKQMLIRYFLGILGQIVILAIILTIGLSIAGVKSALLIAFFGAMLNIIPYVGVIIAVVLGVIISIAEAFPLELYPGMVWLAAKVGLVFWIAQLLDNFITQPLIFSSSVKAHPLEIFLVILAGGTTGGVFGMVLAVPAYTVLRVIAKEFFSEFRIVRELTGDM